MSNDAQAGFRLTARTMLGLLVIAFGLLLTGDNLGWFMAGRVLDFWPLGLMAVGVLKLVQASGASGRIAGTFLIALGALFTAQQTLGLNVDVQDWWQPTAIIALGVFILTRSADRRGRGPLAATDDARVSEFSFWSGKVRRATSAAFRGGDLTAVMGGVEIDLRGASAAPGGAVLDVFVMWGGVEIRVPPDWSVSNEVLVIMGGAEDHSSGSQDSRSHLTVRGFCLMGGVEIKT